MAFFLSPIQPQEQKHPQPTVFQYIPMQNPSHPQYASLQASHPYPGHVIENHNPGPAPAPTVTTGANISPAAAPNQAIMISV
ncbi:hypothetical protein AJ78_08327, partial [Emergomyces pasteurianus Ep9510]